MATNSLSNEAASANRLAHSFVQMIDGHILGKPVYFKPRGASNLILIAKLGWIIRVTEANKLGIVVTDTFKFYYYDRVRPLAEITGVDTAHKMFIQVKLHKDGANPVEVPPSLLNDKPEQYGIRLLAAVSTVIPKAS